LKVGYIYKSYIEINHLLVENQHTRFVDFNVRLVNITNLFFECLSSRKQSGGGVLIAVKRIFDVEEIVTASGDSLEHVCVRLHCFKRSFFHFGGVSTLKENIVNIYQLFTNCIC
jgi:hypothetical protein